MPKRAIGWVPSDVCAHSVIATLESTRASSSTASAYGERVPASAAVLLGERDAHEPELAELADDLVGEALLAVELLRDGRDLVAGEVPDQLLDRPVVVGQLEVHAAHNTDARSIIE